MLLECVVKFLSKLCHRSSSLALSSLTNHGIVPSEIAGLNEALSNVKDPFEGISTTYIREKFYKENFHYLVRCSYLHVTMHACTFVL